MYSGPWYECVGPTREEQIKDIWEWAMKEGFRYKKPYLFLKATVLAIDEWKNWGECSWRGWCTFGIQDWKYGNRKSKIDFIHVGLLRCWAKNKFKNNKIMKFYVNDRLYRYPDGLRIKEIEKDFNSRCV